MLMVLLTIFAKSNPSPNPFLKKFGCYDLHKPIANIVICWLHKSHISHKRDSHIRNRVKSHNRGNIAYHHCSYL